MYNKYDDTNTQTEKHRETQNTKKNIEMSERDNETKRK